LRNGPLTVKLRVLSSLRSCASLLHCWQSLRSADVRPRRISYDSMWTACWLRKRCVFGN